METPAERHFTYLLSVLKYLKMPRMDSLRYEIKREEEIKIRCYCDLDFGGSEFNRISNVGLVDCKSPTGYIIVRV
jgi:hypothetical protein